MNNLKQSLILSKNTFISIHSSLSFNDKKRFQKFLSSPYHNSNNKLIELYNLIGSKYVLDVNDKQSLFNKLYPGKKYNDGMIRNMFSELTGLCIEFLTLESAKVSGALFPYSLRTLSKINQPTLFNRKKNEIEHSLDIAEAKDEEYYYKKYLLADEILFNLQNKGYQSTDASEKILKAENYLTSFYFTNIFKVYALYLNIKKYHMDIQIDMEIFEKLKEAAIKIGVFEIPYVKIYDKCIQLFLKENIEDYFELKKIFSGLRENLNIVDRKNMYVVLVNFCSEQIHKGDMTFLKEQFSIYKDLLKTGDHYEGKSFMSHILFKRIANLALELNEYDWTLKYINEFKDKLLPSFQESSYNFALAAYYFHKEDYSQALFYLSKVKTEDITMKIDSYTLASLIYYSLKYYDSFYSVTEAYSKFLKSNKLINKRRKQLNLSFINIIKKLYKLRESINNDKEFEILKLCNEIKFNNYTYGRAELLKEADKLLIIFNLKSKESRKTKLSI